MPNYSNQQISRNTWSIKNSIFSCLTCTAADSIEVNERNQTGIDSGVEDGASFLQNQDEFGSDSRTLDAAGFRKISAAGPFYLKITKASSFKVKARGEGEDLREMHFEIEEGTLKISPKKKSFGIGHDKMDPIYITIEMPELTEVNMVGATTSEITGFNPHRITLNQTGAARCFMRTDAKFIKLNLTGASETVLEGTSDNLEANLIGGCELNATKMEVAKAKLDIIGGSEANVFVTRSLRGDVTGGSELNYHGSPDEIDVDEGAGGEVNARDN